MDKPNAIELQIAHGATPVPFMIPMKKAVSRQALEEIVRRRTNCGSAPTITMYTRNMVIIDWEDWEELVEPGKRYLADLDDSWIVHSRARGHRTSNESVNMFLGEIEKGKTPASLPKPVSQTRAPATKPYVPVSTTEKETPAAPAHPLRSQKHFPRPANPKMSFKGSFPPNQPRQSSNLNPNSGTFPVPIGPVGIGYGIVNPAIEREVLEALQQQIGTLAVEKPATARQSTGVQPIANDDDKLSTPTESDESQDGPHGGVKLDAVSAPPSAGKVVQKPLDDFPQTVKTGRSNASKPASVSSVEGEVAKMPTAQTRPEKIARQPTSRQTSISISNKVPATKPVLTKSVSGEPTPVQTLPTGFTTTPRTFTKSTPFQPVPAKFTSVDSVPNKRAPHQQVESDNEEEYSHLESPPEIVQRSVSHFGHATSSSGGDEYEDEAYETIDVPGSVSSGFGASQPAKKIQSGQRNDKRQKLLKDENRITFYLVKPQNKDRPIVLDGKGRIFLSTSKECCPLRLIKMLGKNPAYTRLLILTPAPDMSRYITTDVINPGSRFAQTSFSVVGFEDDVTMTWEHVENDEEDEIIRPGCPWDQPDVVNGGDAETYDYEGDDGDDNGEEN
ncbi:uncharacterized protein DFL_009172 [Arthrobotrys flagrans]|uniref:Uncharacterized protein n=1 Tax=Arthrobotrys flagrans TaxID=97331 RepID=A0A436ZQX9_ARTFL|nr:hypothetical protein DFL_009172 [Arthrobotrys flagrans]